MEPILISPAKASILFMPSAVVSLLIPLIGIGLLTYLIAKRMKPLARFAPDFRLDQVKKRLWNTYELPHHRMPRYTFAAAIHISILISVIVLSLRAITLVVSGIVDGFIIPGFGGIVGTVYGGLADVAETVVLIACIVAVIRRGIFKPERYDVPESYGIDRSREAVLLMVLLGTIMVCDMLFQGSLAAAQLKQGADAKLLIPGSGVWIAGALFSGNTMSTLQSIHLIGYFGFSILLFAFICVLPFGRLFHIMTGPFNVFFMKLKKGSIKPVKWGVSEDQVEELESFGVKVFEDFTWKHVLDFYACADCGRCSDQCPANAVGRPLSPRFISLKGRDYAYKHYPVTGPMVKNEEPLMGFVYSEDEIWSCTTCGACEEECPVAIEYIDKMIDLRRGMVDEGMVPQSLQKPLRALEKRGNPYGKMEKKRAEWTKEIAEEVPVKIVGKKETAETLFFVDSATSFDDQVQGIGQSTSRVLAAIGIDFGILGPLEKDSGHEVRRFGEEMLFMDLKEKNLDAIEASGASRIVTADPHAYNALKNDYSDIPPVSHISEFIAEAVQSGALRLKAMEDAGQVFTYHDPCYLGRHNDLYDIPRDVLDAGGLMLYYEPIEETRMGTLRVDMAKQAGANVIVTACPFCMINIADAIKTSGLEGKMEVIDLVQLVDQQLEIMNPE
ncbi:MAG: (Fe-S)-binding protein [Deltaproteobacteria bacterium]|nr:(Fe-S)-binding protein [Deltaproteobacteria bacterium]